MFGLPTLWLYGGLAACLALFAGGVAIRHQAQLAAAQERGVAIGAGQTAKATIETATAIREAQRQAEAEAPMPKEKADKIALCKTSPACRERSQLPK